MVLQSCTLSQYAIEVLQSESCQLLIKCCASKLLTDIVKVIRYDLYLWILIFLSGSTSMLMKIAN